jgi:hypothetical protein
VRTLDQFAKDTFEAETPVITHEAMAWKPPEELGLSEVRLDGLFIVRASRPLAALPAPWSAAAGHDDVVIEVKMAGDHLDEEAIERALLRRQAWQVKRVTSKPPKVGQAPLWIVAPHRPALLGRGGRIDAVLTRAGGCYRLSPAWFDGLWIAANELALSEALIPFLIARSGAALDAFGRWVVGKRSPRWLERMLEVLPMSDTARQEIYEVMPLAPEPEIRQRQLHLTQLMMKRFPEIRQSLIEEGMQPLVHQFERRLGRALSSDELHALVDRFGRLGANRLGDVVLDLSRDALAAWLADPNAT